MPDEQPQQNRTKPLLTVEEQIAHLKAKGVTFDFCTEKEAAEYLLGGNNYLRTASYRALYFKQIEGLNVGKYVNLDFAYLVDLSSIDRQLREALLLAAIDVEHFAKVGILARAAATGEDGYGIVNDYLDSLAHDARRRILGGFRARGGQGDGRDTYSGDLIAHYLDKYPIWVFFEICELGTFVDFYRFCAERWRDEGMMEDHYVLKSVKALRNAAAHNSCIVNGFVSSAKRAGFPSSRPLTDALNAAGMKNSRNRRAKLRNVRIAQIAAVLYSLNAFCGRESAMRRHAARFSEVERRFCEHADFYRQNNSIMSFFDFVWKLVDIWLPVG